MTEREKDELRAAWALDRHAREEAFQVMIAQFSGSSDLTTTASILKVLCYQHAASMQGSVCCVRWFACGCA